MTDNNRTPRPGPQQVRPGKSRPGEVYRRFELKEDLEVDASDGAEADLWEWNPSADDGNGAYEKANVLFRVHDICELGFYGSAGAFGKARKLIAERRIVWEIVDLECP